MFKNFQDIVTVAEIAKMLRIGVNAAYKLVRSGEIPARKHGRKYLIPKKSVIDYLDSIRYTTFNTAGELLKKGEENDR